MRADRAVVQWPSRRFRAMGCVVLITAVPGSPDMLDRAESLVHRLEQRWSRFRTDSELSRLNQRAGTGAVAVSEETFSLVERMVRGWEITDAAFDPTVVTAMEHAGYDRSFELLAPPGGLGADPAGLRVASARPAPGCHGLLLEGATRLITLPSGVRLDAGGIGKGLAADLVVADLMRNGAEGAMASVGGDVRVCGRPPQGEEWTIEIARADGAPVARRPMSDGGVATSSTAVRRWASPGHGDAHHVIDPRTGQPSQTDLRQASVATGRSWWSEVLTTAALILGSSAATTLLDGLGVDAVLIDEAGTPRIIGEAFTLCSAPAVRR